jgi:hypothetical protein
VTITHQTIAKEGEKKRKKTQFACRRVQLEKIDDNNKERRRRKMNKKKIQSIKYGDIL